MVCGRHKAISTGEDCRKGGQRPLELTPVVNVRGYVSRFLEEPLQAALLLMAL